MAFLDWVQPATQPVLTGPRILLRAPRSSDYEAWQNLRGRSRAFLTPWEPNWTDDELGRTSYRLRLRRYRLDARQRTGYTYFVFDREGSVLMGGLTLGRIQRGVAQTGTLGYWMGQSFAGQGVMSQAVNVVSSFAFDVLRLHRLEAACLPRNAASIRLLEKSGFTREGYLRQYLKIAGVWEDHLLYSLLAEDRAPGRAPPSAT
ncbi:GNAT family N-acetyltransferase [Aureimonas sp. AU22]|uniref:GNAT family N-acetyltransferase n=1 Tax=Aureimonas sp. AU22 TaxID=1638162 RepID=UPI0007819556|nr:GNAT family protein [Aureimonas sp. AU22]